MSIVVWVLLTRNLPIQTGNTARPDRMRFRGGRFVVRRTGHSGIHENQTLPFKANPTKSAKILSSWLNWIEPTLRIEYFESLVGTDPYLDQLYQVWFGWIAHLCKCLVCFSVAPTHLTGSICAQSPAHGRWLGSLDGFHFLCSKGMMRNLRAVESSR